MTSEALEDALKSEDFGGVAHFEILRQVANLHNVDPYSPAALDAIIRTLDRKNDFPEGLRSVIESLAVSAGLYPYVTRDSLGLIEGLRVELSRPFGLGEDIVFHEEQNKIYRWLLDGKSVMLNAPTSFGKSLIVDGVLAAEIYSNVVIVLPTLALIDETRRRLQRFKGRYRVITHGSQTRGERNIFVLTQERVLEFDLPEIDFFVIDEFYKLSMDSDPDRAGLLNLAFYELRKTAKAFYLLGPSIQAVTQSVQGRVQAEYYQTEFKTVISEVVTQPPGRRTLEDLLELCVDQTEPTLIFTKSPPVARTVAKALAERLGTAHSEVLNEAADWTAGQYHPEWSYPVCLRASVGLHHGRIPRALQQLSVRLFNEQALRFLVCTSTLIEGVNTAAKTVVIYDNKIATKKFDFFTFNNIRGRAGRMNEHFIGRVFLFNDPPQDPLPTVDIPIVSQPDDLSMQVAVDMDEGDLSDVLAERLQGVIDESILPISIVRQSKGVDPGEQLKFARSLRNASAITLRTLAWSRVPSSEQFVTLAGLILNSFPKFRPAYGSGVSTPGQINRLLRIVSNTNVRDWIREEMQNTGEDADTVVDRILYLTRNYCHFTFPRYMRAAERIIRHEQVRRGFPQANYGYYVNQVEALFQPPILFALDEYGIPSQITNRLLNINELPDDLDEAVDTVEVAARAEFFPPFESRLVLSALGFEPLLEAQVESQ